MRARQPGSLNARDRDRALHRRCNRFLGRRRMLCKSPCQSHCRGIQMETACIRRQFRSIGMPSDRTVEHVGHRLARVRRQRRHIHQRLHAARAPPHRSRRRHTHGPPAITGPAVRSITAFTTSASCARDVSGIGGTEPLSNRPAATAPRPLLQLDPSAPCSVNEHHGCFFCIRTHCTSPLVSNRLSVNNESDGLAPVSTPGSAATDARACRSNALHLAPVHAQRRTHQPTARGRQHERHQLGDVLRLCRSA